MLEVPGGPVCSSRVRWKTAKLMFAQFGMYPYGTYILWTARLCLTCTALDRNAVFRSLATLIYRHGRV
jgi:uncharacterized glyoxalase superfamily metalloenzyme YdcJ